MIKIQRTCGSARGYFYNGPLVTDIISKIIFTKTTYIISYHTILELRGLNWLRKQLPGGDRDTNFCPGAEGPGKVPNLAVTEVQKIVQDSTGTEIILHIKNIINYHT